MACEPLTKSVLKRSATAIAQLYGALVIAILEAVSFINDPEHVLLDHSVTAVAARGCHRESSFRLRLRCSHPKDTLQNGKR